MSEEVKKSPIELFGRKEILTPVESITKDNLVEVLGKALTIHEKNSAEIDYLYRYTRGKQPILSRTKTIRPEINNKVVENHAAEIVQFTSGYFLGEPVTYIRRGEREGASKGIGSLNDMMFFANKSSHDKKLATWMAIAGLGYRMALPNKKFKKDSDESPFLLDIFDDTNTLLDGAEVVAERMRMQLLCPTIDGSPRIVIAANGVQYAYNYDTDGSYAKNNYVALAGDTDKWSDHEKSDPMADMTAGQDAVEAATGVRPSIALMSRATFNHIKANAKVRSAILAQNATANVFMNDARVKELFKTELGITIVVYTKQYKDESGTAQRFYADGYCTLLPAGALGNTWHGVTPEERTLMGNAQADVSVTSDGVAIAVTVTSDPVNTKTTVSEILLPSYERMDETYVIKAY